MLFIKICLVVRFFHQCERSVRFNFGWIIFSFICWNEKQGNVRKKM